MNFGILKSGEPSIWSPCAMPIAGHQPWFPLPCCLYHVRLTFFTWRFLIWNRTNLTFIGQHNCINTCMLTTSTILKGADSMSACTILKIDHYCGVYSNEDISFNCSYNNNMIQLLWTAVKSKCSHCLRLKFLVRYLRVNTIKERDIIYTWDGVGDIFDSI